MRPNVIAKKGARLVEMISFPFDDSGTQWIMIREPGERHTLRRIEASKLTSPVLAICPDDTVAFSPHVTDNHIDCPKCKRRYYYDGKTFGELILR